MTSTIHHYQRIAANYGFNHFVTANAAFAYNKSKASYRFSYNTKYEDDVVNTSLQRNIKATDYNVLQQMEARRYTYNNNITLGADFRIDQRNRLSVDAKCILPRINIRQDLHNTFVDNSVTTDESRHNDVTWNRENIEGSITYTHVIRPDVSDISVKHWTAVTIMWRRLTTPSSLLQAFPEYIRSLTDRNFLLLFHVA